MLIIRNRDTCVRVYTTGSEILIFNHPFETEQGCESYATETDVFICVLLVLKFLYSINLLKLSKRM